MVSDSSMLKERAAKQFMLPRLFLLILLALSSCVTASVAPPGTARVIERVPFYPQDDYQCGPSSLAAVLNLRGVMVGPAEIASAVYSESARGTLDVDMIFYAEAKGLKAVRYQGSGEDLRRNVDAGNPVIVLVDYGFWVYEKAHFMVVIGYNDRGFIVNSGKEQMKFISEDDLLKVWKKTDFRTLLVERK